LSQQQVIHLSMCSYAVAIYCCDLAELADSRCWDYVVEADGRWYPVLELEHGKINFAGTVIQFSHEYIVIVS